MRSDPLPASRQARRLLCVRLGDGETPRAAGPQPKHPAWDNPGQDRAEGCTCANPLYGCWWLWAQLLGVETITVSILYTGDQGLSSWWDLPSGTDVAQGRGLAPTLAWCQSPHPQPPGCTASPKPQLWVLSDTPHLQAPRPAAGGRRAVESSTQRCHPLSCLTALTMLHPGGGPPHIPPTPP